MSMRNALLASLAAASLPGCTTVGHLGECGEREARWNQSPEIPANKLELLALSSGGKPVRDQLAAGVPLQEAWFTDGPNRLMLCRYEAGADVCPVALTVEFTRVSTAWSAGPVQSRICTE